MTGHTGRTAAQDRRRATKSGEMTHAAACLATTRLCASFEMIVDEKQCTDAGIGIIEWQQLNAPAMLVTSRSLTGQIGAARWLILPTLATGIAAFIAVAKRLVGADLPQRARVMLFWSVKRTAAYIAAGSLVAGRAGTASWSPSESRGTIRSRLAIFSVTQIATGLLLVLSVTASRATSSSTASSRRKTSSSTSGTSRDTAKGFIGEIDHLPGTAPPVIHTSETMGIVARKMSEKDLQECVVAMARACGWLCYHTYDSRRSAPGYPDLTMIRASDGRLIHAELKREDGMFRPEQVIWLGELREVARERGTEVYTWRPSDWLDGTIEEALR